MKRIYILTGEIGSGKTTRLIEWCKDKDADGIASPVIDGKRYLMRIKTKEKKLLELPEKKSGSQEVKIGHYKFDKKVFRWAQKKLIEIFSEAPEWFVVDEIGPLELKGQGFEPAITDIFLRFFESESKIILVVRGKLMRQFKNIYFLSDSDFDYFDFNLGSK